MFSPILSKRASRRNTKMLLTEKPSDIIEEFKKLTPEKTSSIKTFTPSQPTNSYLSIRDFIPNTIRSKEPTSSPEPTFDEILKSIELVALLEQHGIKPEKSNEIEQEMIKSFVCTYGKHNLERKAVLTWFRWCRDNHSCSNILVNFQKILTKPGL